MRTPKHLLEYPEFEPDSKKHVQIEKTFNEVLKRRMARRTLLKGAAASLPFVILGIEPPERAKAAAADGLTFKAITLDQSDQVTVPEGYVSNTLIRWGDPVVPGAPAFDINNLSAEAQAQQFGYNCDFLGWFDLPWNEGILTVNHEYVNEDLMFPNWDFDTQTEEQTNISIAAHGLSVLHVRPVPTSQSTFRWVVVQNSSLNRRITGETEIEITGPLAGHPLMKTSYDASGTMVRGMFNNCGGGMTPWGTLITAEENVDGYFSNNGQVLNDAVREYNGRLGAQDGDGFYAWAKHQARFDLGQEPNELNRFGYIVEVDPYDPTFVPKKRTALGRFKHEAASVVITPSGRVAVYSGDDARFEYLYKFVSEGTYDPKNRAANMTLLNSGTLYVAKFNKDGSGEWLPLVFGENGLTPANGFNSQAEVLLYARLAADQLGATPMDRPEDVEWNPKTGKVYMALTNNTRRTEEQIDAANPRANNSKGHIIEITPENEDHAADTFAWEIFMLCGDPSDPEQGAYFAGFDASQVSPIANPDNVAFDRRGNLWIATDGQPGQLPGNDGIFAVPTEGSDRGYLRQFLSGVSGCEIASLVMNRQNNTLFVSVQHPGEGGSFEEPISNFPDGNGYVRPSVVAVTKAGGPDYRIGS